MIFPIFIPMPGYSSHAQAPAPSALAAHKCVATPMLQCKVLLGCEREGKFLFGCGNWSSAGTAVGMLVGDIPVVVDCVLLGIVDYEAYVVLDDGRIVQVSLRHLRVVTGEPQEK